VIVDESVLSAAKKNRAEAKKSSNGGRLVFFRTSRRAKNAVFGLTRVENDES
jgi:hypothetical protein